MGISNNLLLYGPPGTGKTYNTVNYAVAIIEGRSFDDVVKDPYDLNLEKYDRYTKMGRISFMTFHQSLGYDDFIEGIKPVTGDDGVSLLYLPTPGVFYEFCRTSQMPRSINAKEAEGSELVTKDSSYWIFSPGGYGDNDVRSNALATGRVDATGTLMDLAVGDVLISMFSEQELDAIGVITSQPSEHDPVAGVKWLSVFQTPYRTDLLRISDIELKDIPGRLHFITRNEVMALTETRPDDDTDCGDCVFIIDEINRGNISKIFGELITLIESSRRMGQPECLEVFLPQMKRKFSIPTNVYILGTMNTADKSLAALDTALRRRFEFVEMMPDANALKGRVVSDVDLGRLLTVMNTRIEMLYDREHMMGQAYFISVRTMEQLAVCFKKKVIPLLQEYFFDDYEKMAWVMGKATNPRECPFIRIREKNSFQLMFDLPDVLDIVDDDSVFMNPENYIQIYKGADGQ